MLTINKNYSKRLWVVDDFYIDIGGMVDFGWKQEFVYGQVEHGIPGRYTKEKFLLPGVKDAFENIIGKRIVNWETVPLNGRYKINYNSDIPYVGCEDYSYAGIVFLTYQLSSYPNGFNLLVHKDTGNYKRSQSVSQEQLLDINNFDVADSVGYQTNRLILFDPQYYHTIPNYYGQESGGGWDGFLTQVFYFD